MSTHEQRYLIRKSRYSIATNVILFCVVLLSIVACVMLDSLSATRESQRMQSYGAWHAALYNADDDLAKQLAENVMVDSIGIMYICGEICDASGTDCGAIGYITEELLDFGNIELLDGSLPTQADEIALESSVLSKLGYSYELGQTVYLPLRNSDNEDCTYRSFVLSGVVKNYSGNWKCKNNHLVSGFVDASNEAEYQHAFIKLADKYAKYAEDINSICMHRLVLNDYTYSIYSSGNSDILDINLLQIAILFSGFTILLLLVNNEITKKQSDYVVLQLLGANRSSIIGMFVHEKIVKFLMMILLGTSCGIFTAFLIHKIFLNSQGDVFFVNYSHVFVTVILNLAGILIALFFSFVRLFQIPLRGKAEQNGRRRSRLPRKPLTRQTIFLRFHWNDIHSRLLSLGLSVISALFVCISFYQTWNLFSDYKYYAKEYPIDYIYGLIASYSRPQARESEDTITRIKGAYGVEDVFGYSVSAYQPINFEGEYDVEYATMINRELDAFFSKNGTDEYPDSAETCGSLVGISPRLIPYYCSIAECAKKSNYLADNEVILYLPNRYQNSKTVSESLIKEGDNITFTYLDQEYSLTVAGIIRDLDNEPFCYQIPRPYSLICSQSTYDRICGKNDYVYILVKRDNKSIAYQTDTELSKIKTSLFFTNNRITKEEYKNNTYMQLLIALLISSAGIVMVILARYGIQMVTNKYEVYRYKTLYQLGMEVRRIRSALRVDAVIESFLAVIIATLAELIWIYIRTRAVYTTASFIANSKLELFMQLAKAFVTSTHWWFIVGMAIIMFIINYLLLAMKSHILIKNLAQD